jgi:DNA-binding MarR family transcriptional regulator
MTDRPSLTTRTIGETENALGGLLPRALAGTDLDRLHRIAISIVNNSPASLSTSRLGEQLESRLKVDHRTAMHVIDDLRAEGILESADGELSMTPDGSALYQRLTHQVHEMTQRLWSGLDADDLAAAYRVLSTITQRANTMLAG